MGAIARSCQFRKSRQARLCADGFPHISNRHAKDDAKRLSGYFDAVFVLPVDFRRRGDAIEMLRIGAAQRCVAPKEELASAGSRLLRGQTRLAATNCTGESRSIPDQSRPCRRRQT